MTITDELKGEVVAQGTSLSKGTSATIDLIVSCQDTLLGSLDDLDRHCADIGTSPYLSFGLGLHPGWSSILSGFVALYVDCCSLVGD